MSRVFLTILIYFSIVLIMLPLLMPGMEVALHDGKNKLATEAKLQLKIRVKNPGMYDHPSHRRENFFLVRFW